MEKYVLSCRTSTAISSLIDNVSAVACEFIKHKFPNEFFKHVYISSSLNSTNLRNNKIQKYKLPALSLVCEPSFTPNDTFLEMLPRWHQGNEFIYNNKRKNYDTVLCDEVNKVYIYSIPNRIKINFNARIKLPTTLAAYEIQHYILTNFDIGGYKYLNNIKLETEIPYSYIQPISKRFNYNLECKDDLNNLSDYLYENSYGGINENQNLSTGNRMYSYKYNSNILLGFPDAPEKDDNVKNLSLINSTVSFNFSMELWMPSNFILEMENINNEIEYKDFDMTYDMDHRFLYNLFIDTHYIKNYDEEKDMHLIRRKKYIPDVNVEYDELNLDPILDTELIKVIQETINAGYGLERLLDVKLMCGNKFLSNDDFNVDWKGLTLKTMNPMSNTTYTIFIYGNLKKLNNISEQINQNKKITDVDI